MNSTGSSLRSARRPDPGSGFTLVEMLAVLAVMALLWAIAVPAFTGMLASQRLTGAAGELSGVIERGLLFSKAQNTHVWLRLGTDDEGVVLDGFFSRDGTDDGQSAANVARLGDTRRLDGVAIVRGWDGPLVERPEADAALSEEGGWLLISPRGEVALVDGDGGDTPPERPGGLARWGEIALINEEGSGANVAILQVAGLTGQRMVYRP